MSNTNHPDDLSPEAQLAKKFKRIVLPTITSAEARAIVAHGSGWENVSIGPAPADKSLAYFTRTINVSDRPLSPGEAPARIATFVARDHLDTPLQTLHPLSEMDQNSAQYALTKKFFSDLQLVRGEITHPEPATVGYKGLDKPSRSGHGVIFG